MANRLALGSSLLIAMLGLSACAAAATPSVPTNVASASPSQPATPAATASPSPTASPSMAVPAATLCAGGQLQDPCELPAGTYSADPFKPGFRFTISDPWMNERRYADGGSISSGEAAFFWASGVTTGTLAGNAVDIEPGPEGFVAFLEQFEGFTLSEPVPVQVDGVAGIQFDLETNNTAAPQLFEIRQDIFNFDAGEKARFVIVDKDGITAIFIVDAFKEAGFDAFLIEAQPVLDSVTWE